MLTRKATVTDAKFIHDLIKRFAKKYDMLPRSLNEIYENIRDFFICIDKDSIVAVAALHILWEDLAEVRSVAVSKDYQGIGVGKRLVKRCVREAKGLGVSKVFALTYAPEFFKEMDFRDVDKSTLPQKIWGECLKCHKFPECDESAVMLTIKN